MADFLGIVTGFFDFLWSSFLLLAPMLLLGLFLSGLIHVFISRQAILRWLRDDSLKSVTMSSAIGVPVPLCSCSVVPVVAEMRNKGASRSSCMSFLITAPETGADSILVTNAFFGPIVAIVRPIISFITAVVAGIFCIGLIRKDHDHDHGHEPLISDADDCYVSPSQLKILAIEWLKRVATAAGRWRFGSWVKPDFYREEALLSEKAGEAPSGDAPANQELDFKRIVKHIFRYGFVEIADDILFALLVGVALGGVLFLAIPSDLMSNEYARWLSYPVMILIGIPLYICASASTPIAAALVARGFSPGAALIFLMTGPATNTGTIAIIVSQFGARFASIYVASVIVVTALLGIAIDALLLAFGLTISVNLSASDSPAIQFVQWGGAFLLIALIIWRFRAGALKSGWEDLLLNLRPVSKSWRQTWGSLTRGRSFSVRGLISPTAPMGLMLWALALVLFLGSGFTTVPPGYVGYGRLFGEVYWRDLSPGLHYLAPRPLVQVDKWPVREVKSILCDTPQDYVSGDLNLISLTVNVQYRVEDPYNYHYRTTNPEEIISDVVQAHIRSFVSARDLEKLLNVHRVTLEQYISESFPSDVHPENPVLNTVDLVKINLLAITPVAETMSAFRDVSSAQEDRERIIVNAQRFLVSLTPQAHGNAAWEVEQADGEAYRKVTTSAAEAKAISLVSEAVRSAPDVLQNMLWREKLEIALSGNAKVIVPNKESLNKVALWKRNGSTAGKGAHH
ncbi:MAG: SO_0444 family Cu/Zn efflux transporter [Candidatus Latescibacteria bacterium]|nr:SO_0444 family Cu/Zn efflux transporter [Candidatus Latescibacterota bacterium]